MPDLSGALGSESPTNRGDSSGPVDSAAEAFATKYGEGAGGPSAPASAQSASDATLYSGDVFPGNLSRMESTHRGGAGAGASPGAGASLASIYYDWQEHAKGGLGTVYKAIDKQLKRKVAIKEVQRRFENNASLSQLFLQEAEITGGLEHPGIVPIYGLGSHPDGRAFYAMRFIQGKTLDQEIRDFYAEGGPIEGPRAVRFRDLIVRFIGVCQAIAYAHNRGVLHRDLKPQNIMLGQYGETLVVDWGLAACLGRVLSGEATADQEPLVPFSSIALAQQRGVSGTPAFMSPEQASGKVAELGPECDVYGLGATLYTLLSGKPPFNTDKETLDRVRLGAFPAPRSLRPDCPKALEAICLKAMTLRPHDRYPNAVALAADLQRWLADEPVSAYPEPLPERAARWVRRNKSLFIAGVGALALAAIGFAIFSAVIAAQKAETEKQRVLAVENGELATKEQKRAEGALDLAKSALGQTSGVLDQMSGHVIEDWLARQKELTPEQRQFLERIALEYKALAQRKGADDPDQLGEVAKANRRLGDIYRLLGRPTESEEKLTAAIEFAKRAAAASPKPEYDHLQALALSARGRVRFEMKQDAKAAESDWREALVLRQKLVDGNPTNPEYRRVSASARNNLAIYLKSQNRLEEGEREAETAVQAATRLADEFPKEPLYRRDLATQLVNLGELRGLGEKPKAEEALDRALELHRKLAAEHPREPDYRRRLADNLDAVGVQRARKGNWKDALTSVAEAASIYRKLADEYRSVPDYALGFVRASLNRAEYALRADQPAAVTAALSELEPLLKRAEALGLPESARLRSGAHAVSGMAATKAGKPATPDFRAAAMALIPSDEKSPATAEMRGELLAAANRWAAAAIAENSHAGAADAAEILVKHATKPDEILLAASLLVRCMSISGPDAPPEQVADKYADRAIDLLSKLISEGQVKAEQVEATPEFAPLLARPGVKKQLQDVGKK
jgi:serine/threonine-protein kinase